MGTGGNVIQFPQRLAPVFTHGSVPRFSGKPCSLAGCESSRHEDGRAHPKDDKGGPRFILLT